MKGKSGNEEEERIWILSAVPLVPVLILVIVFVVPEITSSFAGAFGYSMLTISAYCAAVFAIYEVASGLRKKETIHSRIKRFVSRTVYACTFAIGWYSLWNLLTFLLSSVLGFEYVFFVSLLAISLMFAIFLKNPRTGHYIRKLIMEEQDG